MRRSATNPSDHPWPQRSVFARDVLWVAAQEDDEQVFEQVKLLLTPALSRLASTMLATRRAHFASVDDLVNETWDRAWKARRSYRGQPQPLTWLYPIMQGALARQPASRPVIWFLAKAVRSWFRPPGRTPTGARTKSSSRIIGPPSYDRSAHRHAA